MRTTPGLAHQRQALVELVRLAVVSQRQPSLLRRLESLPALVHTRTRRVQGFNRQERKHER